MSEYLSSCIISSNRFLYKSILYLITLLVFYANDNHSQVLSAEKIYDKVSGAVVVINGYDSRNVLLSQGSGVILNDKGFVITNYHILAECERFEILHNKKIISYDDITVLDIVRDIMIFKIKNKKFVSLKIGDSKTLHAGQKVYAIGNPLGFQNTISEGIISGIRVFEESGLNFIQITASISPGSSGGAVVNDKAELIGISTLTAREGQNMNFAIPIDEVLAIQQGSYLKGNSLKDYESYLKGKDAFERGEYHEAISFYSIFIEKFPTLSIGYNNRGLAKKNLNDIQGAIKDFSKAIEISPNSMNAYFNLGNSYLSLKDFNKATRNFNKVVEISPNFAEGFYNRGLSKGGAQDNLGAIQDFSKAIEINPAYADAYLIRGISKYFLNDNIGACSDFSKAGELGLYKAYDLIKKYCK